MISAAVLLLLPSASAVCETDPVHRIFDYARDLQDPFVNIDTDTHPEADILEIRSCLVGDDLTAVIRTRADVITDSPDIRYSVTISHPDIFPYSVTYSNGTAIHFDYSGDLEMNATASGKEVVISIPKAEVENITGGWKVTGEARVDEDSDGLSEWIDDVDLNTFEEYGEEDDITLEPTPFASPSVAIDSLKVVQNGTTFEVTVKGKTTGAVAQLRVSMGVELIAGGVSSWSFRPYWVEQSRTGGDTSIEVSHTGDSWASWTFVREYTESQLNVIQSPLITVGNAKVEVRAVGNDGSWGHANRTFNPTQEYDSEAPPAAGDSGGGFMPGFEAAGAAAAVIAAASVMAGRRNRRP